MAELVMKDIKEDFLHCSICFERLKVPKMLPCIHTFCSECLEKYVESCTEKQLTCPTCRKGFALPEYGVKGLQTNFHMVNLGDRIDLFEKLTSCSKKSHQCDSCDSMDVSTYCLDCENIFCTACNDHHARFSALRSHSVLPIEKFKEKYFQDSLKNTKVPFCDLHSSENLRFYCKTCSTMICRDCTIVQHPRPEHQYVEGPSQVKEIRELLTSLLRESQAQLASKMRYVEEGNTGVKSVRETAESLKQGIISYYEQTIKAIEEDLKSQMESLCAKVTDLEKSQSANIKGCVDVASIWIKRAQNTHKLTQKMMEEGNMWELLAMSKDLINAFRTLRMDANEFEWHRSDMEHGIPLFSPATIPSFNLGGFIHGVDLVVSDPEGNFITCAFDFPSSILQLTRLKKGNDYETSQADYLPPYKWEKYFPGCAKLTATADHTNCVFIGLGRWLARFSFSTKAIEAVWEASDDEDSFITSIDFNYSQKCLYLIDNNRSYIRQATESTVRNKSEGNKIAWNNSYKIPSEYTAFDSIISFGEVIFFTSSISHSKQLIFAFGYNEFICNDIIGLQPNNLEDSKMLSMFKGVYQTVSRIPFQMKNQVRDIYIGNFYCYFLWSDKDKGYPSGIADGKLVITEYDFTQQKISNTWNVSGGDRSPLACIHDRSRHELRVCDRFGRIIVYQND